MRLTFSFKECLYGGGKAVGIGILRALASRTWPHEISAFIPDNSSYNSFSGGSIRLVKTRYFGGIRQLVSHRQLYNFLVDGKQDAVFMLGSRSLRRSPCPQALLVHNPCFLYPEFGNHIKVNVARKLYDTGRDYSIKKGLNNAAAILVQTPVMRQRIQELCDIPDEKLFVMPVGSDPILAEKPSSSKASEIVNSPYKLKLLCLAKCTPNKNLNILLSVADKLIEMGVNDIGIFVTVSKDPAEISRWFISEMCKNNRDRIICNIGEVAAEDVYSCYRAVNALFLPTLAESLCIPYFEAMKLGVPIITSDLDFARFVCGKAAIYIDPIDAASIAGILFNIRNNINDFSEQIALGREQFNKNTIGWDEAVLRMVDLLEAVSKKKDIT